MLTLAQRIFDTAHNMKVNARQAAHNASQAAYGTFRRNGAKDFQAEFLAASLFQSMAGIPDIAEVLSNSMKFSIDQAVADAVVKMDKTPLKTLLGMLPYAKLPYPQTWIEFCLPEGDLNIGWLIEHEDKGVAVRYIRSNSLSNHTPEHVPHNHYLINSQGIHPHTSARSMPPPVFSAHDQERDERFNNYILKSTLNLLLLLNSRSKILQIDPPTIDVDKKNQKNKRLGRPEIATLNAMNKLRFDVARIVGKTPGLGPEDAAEIMAAALVRGHFKVRKTGVFFWSPYVRGASSEDEKNAILDRGLSRENATVKTGHAGHPACDFNA